MKQLKNLLTIAFFAMFTSASFGQNVLTIINSTTSDVLYRAELFDGVNPNNPSAVTTLYMIPGVIQIGPGHPFYNAFYTPTSFWGQIKAQYGGGPGNLGFTIPISSLSSQHTTFIPLAWLNALLLNTFFSPPVAGTPGITPNITWHSANVVEFTW